MQWEPMEVLIVSNQRRSKRSAKTWKEKYLVYKKRCKNLLICPMEGESSLLLKNRKCNCSSIDIPVTSSIHQPKKTLTSSKYYNPFDFTSDELNPAYEWLRNTSSAGKYIADIIALLRDILSPFTLGLRLKKLEAIVWSKYKIQLSKLSLDQGYRGSLQFLEALPGIILKFHHRRPFRCLVLLDPVAKFHTDYLIRADTSRKSW